MGSFSSGSDPALCLYKVKVSIKKNVSQLLARGMEVFRNICEHAGCVYGGGRTVAAEVIEDAIKYLLNPTLKQNC